MAKLHLTSLDVGLLAALCGALLHVGCAKGGVSFETTGTGGSGAVSGASGASSGGTGGAGGTTTAGAAGTGGHPGTNCTVAADCVALSDACNVGACINGTCGTLPANDGSACEDGKQCTQNDVCVQGVCKPGPTKNCPTNGPCTVGVCDVEQDKCVDMPGNNGGFCNLGDPCVVVSACLNGVCQPSQVKDCSFLNSVCGDGVCDPQQGCISLPKNDGALCDDGLYCTVQDQCIAGKCQGAPNTCAPPGDVCKIGVCNEGLKTCVAMPGNDGQGCDDGNPCTAGETCAAGTCIGGTPANNGMACDDKNGCTVGTSCANGACANPQSQIVTCVDGDQCCPAGCANDKDCLWYVPGVQQNIPEAQLTGWTPCFTDTYADSNTPMSQILNQCTKNKLMLACRTVGSPILHTLAMAPRVDVLFDCGSQVSCTKESNGVGWYYSDSYSWGFCPAGQTVARTSCDTANTGNEDRVCWHSSGGFINGGWRCGANTGLNGDPGWERIVYQAD